MARACAARYRKQARGACQAAATALAVVASGLALTSVLLPVLAGAAIKDSEVGRTQAVAALGFLGFWDPPLVRWAALTAATAAADRAAIRDRDRSRS